jgi:transposase
MDQYEHVRTASRIYGHSINKISRDTGHSRNTIRKAPQEEQKGYSPRQKQSFSVLGPFSQTIGQWLLADKEEPKKQRHTSHRIYNRLVIEYGFKGSESNVRKFVREARARLDVGRPQIFIPLSPELGQEAEIDWVTATVKIDGQPVTVKMFCTRSKGSGKHFVRLYPCERQQAFFDGMMRGFAFYRGIFSTLIFNHLTSVVKKVLVGVHPETITD